MTNKSKEPGLRDSIKATALESYRLHKLLPRKTKWTVWTAGASIFVFGVAVAYFHASAVWLAALGGIVVILMAKEIERQRPEIDKHLREQKKPIRD